jgi:hypothetical protein
MTDRRNPAGYHHIREDYEIRSKQEVNKKLKDKDPSTIEYSENSADEWDIKTHLESSDDNIIMSPSR